MGRDFLGGGTDHRRIPLSEIRKNHGAEAIVFGRSTPAGSAAADFAPWLQRLANAFGSPNLLTTTHICTWTKIFGAKYTFGTPTPPPDYENTGCILLWGANPRATAPTAAQGIGRARRRGAKLIVIDPRQHALARDADCWLRVRPGSDSALALGMMHVLFDENLYDEDFVRDWTDGPHLIRDDTHQPLTARDISLADTPDSFVVWDSGRDEPVTYHSDTGYAKPGVIPALTGTFLCRLHGGTMVSCRPVLALLRSRAARYALGRSEDITWVPADMVRRATRLFATERPSCYFSWAGLEMHTNAMQINRAVSCFYALTGQFDAPGGNVLPAVTPARPVDASHLLPKEKAALRLGLASHSLGPPADPGRVQAANVYEAILTEQPYKVRAMLLFGSDPLMSHGDVLVGQRALMALDYYVHMDVFANRTASFADLLLPAATSWESEAVKMDFSGRGGKPDANGWTQLRQMVVPPPASTRPDMAVIFDLACRLGMADHFFGGDMEAAMRYQLEPSGITLDRLRANPVGIKTEVVTRYRKYAELDAKSGHPSGFATPSRKLELYSPRLAAAGYDPLPKHEEPAESPIGAGQSSGDYPLVLTSFRLLQFVNQQHRHIPRLRDRAREPLVEVHPETASAIGVPDGGWVHVETISGKARLKAKYNDSLHHRVVCVPYGWWQGCEELGLPGHDPLSSEGANINLAISNTYIDPIGASVPHRSRMCRISKDT